MNYEQMYKDALERARSIRFGNPNSATANVVCEDIFPELKEISDDKIRKEIADFIRWDIDRGSITKEQKEKTNSWLAWLEKQDPQAIKEELRTEYEKGRADAIAEMQNHEWTEEDERKLELIKSLIDNVKEDSYSYSTIFREMDELNKWVESFKNRIQTKQELNEDDIEITTAHWANA